MHSGISQDPLYRLLRPVLFSCEAEKVHELTLRVLKNLSQLRGFGWGLKKFYGFEHPALQTHVWGRCFVNPIGVAAGFDKNALVFNPLFALGFGFVEVGTVTPLPQPGHPLPRLFRLPADHALINRLGFNNWGAEALAKQISNHPPDGILGVNLGKNQSTPMAQAIEDYAQALRKIYDHAAYIVLNVSSPNTEKLRGLQEKQALGDLLECLLAVRKELVQQKKPQKPILLKIAPDFTEDLFHNLLTTLEHFRIDGIIATNTTLRRENLSSGAAQERGGLSGAPLKHLSTGIIGRIYQKFENTLPIVGVGGVFTGQDAYEKIRAGASLVQIYTGMIYRGPAIAKNVKKELLALLIRDGFTSIAQAVGADHR